MSKCRGESGLGLYTFPALTKRVRLCSGNFRQIMLSNVFLNWKSPLRNCILFVSTRKVHRPRPDSPLHFDIRNTYTIRTGKCNASTRRLLPATMLERLPHVCRVKITFELLTTIWFVSTTMNSMHCLVNWIPVKIRVRLRNTQPHLKVGWGESQTNVNSQWNPVYKAFHRIHRCANESIGR